jgi:hypothetical protein
MSEQPSNSFLGTYFDRDSVLNLANLAAFFSWIVAVIYGAQLALSVLIYILQLVRGQVYALGLTDYAQQILLLVEQPFRGMVYFIALQALSKILLMFMDIEDNTRRAARTNTKES